MDTVHDLGGRQGFGPIRWHGDDDAVPYHEPWQGRSWATCMTMMARFRREEAGWTLDWHRHVLERTPPADYLSMDYYDKWTVSMMAVAIDEGLADVDEFVAATARFQPAPPIASPLAASAEPPVQRFAVGDRVAAKATVGAMHIRLPAYVRGRQGVIESCLGLTVLADTNAEGDPREEPRYTIRFAASDLWPEAAGSADGVYVDLWESHLDPA